MSDTSSNNSPWNKLQKFKGEKSQLCPRCGEKVPADASFCPYCGTWFTGNPQSIQPEPQRRDNSNILVIVAAVLASVAAILVGFLFIAPLIVGKSSGSESSESAPAMETAAENDAEEAAEPSVIPTVTPTLIPTATPTLIPTATPTPIPTSTPTEIPPQTISRPNIIDASTGQLISIPNDTADSFAYPDSGNRVWSYGDVNGMTAGQVRYCINEIYAKHGYIFQNENWLNYFKQKTWYSPTIPKASFGDHYLNSTEVANVKLLNRYYTDRKFPDY